MRAIGERIAKAPSERITNFGETLETGRGIGRDLCAHQSRTAFRNPKAARHGKRTGGAIFDGIDPCEGRAFGSYSGDKVFGNLRGGGNADQDAFRIIEHLSVQSELRRAGSR